MGGVAFVFAGQGAQKVGMGHDLYDHSPAARAMFDQAESVWPGVQALCFEGPADRLNQTINTQPGLFVTDLACAAAVEEAGISSDGAAGFSLGEVAAAVFVGLMSFEQGFAFVQQRAEAMEACGQRSPGTMFAVLGLDRAAVEATAASVGQAWPVNYNCPGQIAVACAVASAPALRQVVISAGGKAIPLTVSAAFHTPLMDPAAAELAEVTAHLEFGPPQLPLYANLTAEPYGDAARLLAAQVNHPVRWQDSVEAMVTAGFDRFVEVGPGATLSGFIRKTDGSVQTMNVNDSASLAQTVQALHA